MINFIRRLFAAKETTMSERMVPRFDGATREAMDAAAASGESLRERCINEAPEASAAQPDLDDLSDDSDLALADIFGEALRAAGLTDPRLPTMPKPGVGTIIDGNRPLALLEGAYALLNRPGKPTAGEVISARELVFQAISAITGR